MYFSYKVEDETCPLCGESDEVSAYDKDEGAKIKICYTCEECW